MTPMDAPLDALLGERLVEMSDANLRAFVQRMRENRLSPQTLRASLKDTDVLEEDLSEVGVKRQSQPRALDIGDLL